VLVFSQKWLPEEAANALKLVLKNPFIEFYNQTQKTSLIALNPSVKHNLDGRDALIIVNYIANKTPTLHITTKNS